MKMVVLCCFGKVVAGRSVADAYRSDDAQPSQLVEKPVDGGLGDFGLLHLHDLGELFRSRMSVAVVEQRGEDCSACRGRATAVGSYTLEHIFDAVWMHARTVSATGRRS